MSDTDTDEAMLGGQERKMKFIRLVTTQKINFRRRKPSSSLSTLPMKSASEHRRSEIDPVGRRIPIERSFDRDGDIGDDLPPESRLISPLSSKRDDLESPPKLRSPLATPLDTNTPDNEKNKSVPPTPKFSRSNREPPVDNDEGMPDNTVPQRESDENDPANSGVSEVDRHDSPTVIYDRNNTSSDNNETNEDWCTCYPCVPKKSSCTKYCFPFPLLVFLIVLCVLLAYYLLYNSKYVPPFCCDTVKDECNLDPPRWIL